MPHNRKELDREFESDLYGSHEVFGFLGKVHRFVGVLQGEATTLMVTLSLSKLYPTSKQGKTSYDQATR